MYIYPHLNCVCTSMSTINTVFIKATCSVCVCVDLSANV